MASPTMSVNEAFSPRSYAEMLAIMVESATDWLEGHWPCQLKYYKMRCLASDYADYPWEHIGTADKFLLRQIAKRYLADSDPDFWYAQNGWGYGEMMLFWHYYGQYFDPEKIKRG